jgi:hypothetical protein
VTGVWSPDRVEHDWYAARQHQPARPAASDCSIDALRQGKVNEVEAFDAVAWAAHAVATHDDAGLDWRVAFFRSVHGIAPDLGKAQP